MNKTDISLHNHLHDPGRLAALKATALLDTPMEEAFDRLTRLAARFTGAPVALVSLVDADRQYFKSCIGLPEPWSRRRETPLSHSFCQHNRVDGEPLIVADAREHPLFRDNPAVRDLSVIAYLGIPLVTPDGYVLGSFCVIDTRPHAWSERDVETVGDLAAAVMTEIDLRTEMAARKRAEGDRDELAALYASLQDQSEARQRAEAALHEALQRQREAVKSANVGLWDWNLTTNTIHYSRECKNQIGYQDHEISDDRTEWESRMHPEDLASAREAIDRSLSGLSKNYEAAFRLLHKDGTYRWILAQGSVIADETGVPAKMMGSHIDITERKRVEEELNRNKGRYQALFEYAPYGIVIADAQSNYTDANASMCRMLGYTREEFIGLHASDIVTREETRHIETALKEIKSDAEHNRVWRFRRKDGSVFDGEVSATTLPDGQLLGIVRDITERQQIEAALRQSLKFNQRIPEVLPLVMYILDLGTRRTVYINREVAVTIGYTPDQVKTLGDDFITRLMHPADVKRFESHMQALTGLSEESTIEFEYRMKAADGTWHWFMSRDSVFETDENGRPTRILGTAADITEFKQAEAVILHERNLSDKIINSMPGLVYLFDRDGRFLRWNHNFGTAIGYTDDEVSRLPVLELFRGIDREVVAKGIRKAFETGQSDVEVAMVAKDGRTTPYYFTGRRIDYEGRDCLIGMGVDITERHLAEAALRDSERRFRDLVGMLPVVVYETDRDLKLTFANQHACELFGHSEDDLVRGMSCLDLIDPRDHDRVEATVARSIEGENPGTLEYRAIKKDGSVIPVLLRATPVLKDSQFAGLRGIIVDISDRKQQEEERSKITDQLRQAQKMESIGRLAGGVAHDLNNVLSPIIGYAELLQHECDRHDARREYAEQIFGAGMRAKDIVHQLLAFSRKQTLEVKPVNLKGILTHFEKLLRRTIREDIDIETVASPAAPVIMADKGQIEQVVMNLAVNAQDAMPKGGKLVFEIGTVELDRDYCMTHPDTTPGPYAVLTVSDSGSGMDAQTRELLFEPFFSTKGDKGTGLGLATVYGIVKQHNGSIWVYSEPGMGTTFKIYLPMPEKAPSRLDPAAKARTDVKGSETILVVEDDASVRLLAHDILVKQGYTILVAENGAEALKALSAHGRRVDMLLTDVVMPEMNGKELYLQAVKQCPGLKVLFMSGYTDDIIAHHGILEKDVPFINKPFSADDLSIRVRNILDAPQRLENE